MKEFYEPMLYLSTPDHPNTMAALAVLKEAVDGEILRNVVEDLRPRFPYFYVQAVAALYEKCAVPLSSPQNRTDLRPPRDSVCREI